MSFTTGTMTEALAANSAVGSAFASFTSAQFISANSGAAYLPANFFEMSGGNGVGKSIYIKAFGVLSVTGTPNFTMAVSLNTTQGTYSANVLATTAAVAMSSGVTNVPWELDVIATCASVGASGSFLSDGMFKVYNAITSATAWGGYRCSSSTANPNTAVTISTQSAYYLELAGTWSASSASNTVTVYQLMVLGLN
jgi:hypothetical protein